MGKELRTLPIELKVQRTAPLDTSHWKLKQSQTFFPPLEKLFKTETLTNVRDYGVRLSHPIQKIVDEDHIQVKGKTVEIHRKTTMILSPFKWMRGDYGTMGLPNSEENASDQQETLQSAHTAGYVGALTSILLSESECIHFPRVYGVYVGLADMHTIDISDDYEDLSERKWFGDQIGKTFELKLRPHDVTTEFNYTRSQRATLALGEDVQLEGFQDLEAEPMDTPSTRSHSHSEEDDESFSESDFSSEDDDDEFEIRSCDCSDDGEEEGLDDEGDDEPFAWAIFSKVPVITTVMEKCTGTFYDLLEKHSEPEKHCAWVSQMVFALAYAQRNFGFTHNDLHGNNVMYIPTDQEFLYYTVGGHSYKVPTYGYIIKLIDFDRAITTVRLCGMKEPRTFVSSQFQSNDEAAGQYNIEPFFTSTQPRIPPNPNFDLGRFATSVFWDFFPEGPTHAYTHPLFEVFKQWMTQQDGTSVLFRKELDRHDRYHGFDLYKAIARYCKNSAVPRDEISKMVSYQIPSIPLGASYLLIDS
jgi:hypothetical protein